AWMLIVMLPVDLLLCWMILSLSEGGGRLDEPDRWFFFLSLLLSPLLWLSSVRFGHNESAMVLFVLAAIAAGERGRPILAGLMWGLALEMKTTAIVPALAYYGWASGNAGIRSTLKGLATAAGTFLAPLLPYLVLRREQVSYALVGFERIRPLGG